MSSTLDRDSDALRTGIHFLTAALLVVGIFTSVKMPLSQSLINLLLLVGFAAVYYAGSIYAEQWPRPVRYLWISILTVLWGADLFVAPAAIYLVFVMYFVYLTVLDVAAGILCVIGATVLTIVVQIPGGLTFGGVMGPAVSALVTVAITYAFRTLSRMNRELIETVRSWRLRNETPAWWPSASALPTRFMTP